jgi:hypothetical protein
MKLSEKDHQFNETEAWVIVNSKQNALLYKLFKGEFMEVDSCNVDMPTYSDNEGFFQTSGNGQVHNTGNVREDKQDIEENVIKEFLTELRGVAKVVEGGQLYLFTPDYMAERVKSVLPHNTNIKNEWHGNYVNSNERDIVSMITDHISDKKVVPTSEEAQKILDKTE